MNSMEALEIYQKIARADWYYNYCDDYGAFLKGQASCSAVRSFINEREWSQDDVEMIRNEAMNAIALDTKSDEESKNKRVIWWNEKIDQLFKGKVQ